MATNKLINSTLSGVFTTDPSVALFTWLKSNWGTVTGYTVPDASEIKFDTKFGGTKGFFNYVIVESVNVTTDPQVLGSSRYHSTETKRVQILCVGPSSRNTRYQMEKHIESIINGNPTAMQSDGIHTFDISDFQELNLEAESTVTSMTPNKQYQTSRSFATVEMRYDLEQTTA